VPYQFKARRLKVKSLSQPSLPKQAQKKQVVDI
jgi:hypothetical protein